MNPSQWSPADWLALPLTLAVLGAAAGAGVRAIWREWKRK